MILLRFHNIRVQDGKKISNKLSISDKTQLEKPKNSKHFFFFSGQKKKLVGFIKGSGKKKHSKLFKLLRVVPATEALIN